MDAIRIGVAAGGCGAGMAGSMRGGGGAGGVVTRGTPKGAGCGGAACGGSAAGGLRRLRRGRRRRLRRGRRRRLRRGRRRRLRRGWRRRLRRGRLRRLRRGLLRRLCHGRLRRLRDGWLRRLRHRWRRCLRRGGCRWRLGLWGRFRGVTARHPGSARRQGEPGDLDAGGRAGIADHDAQRDGAGGRGGQRQRHPQPTLRIHPPPAAVARIVGGLRGGRQQSDLDLRRIAEAQRRVQHDEVGGPGRQRWQGQPGLRARGDRQQQARRLRPQRDAVRRRALQGRGGPGAIGQRQHHARGGGGQVPHCPVEVARRAQMAGLRRLHPQRQRRAGILPAGGDADPIARRGIQRDLEMRLPASGGGGFRQVQRQPARHQIPPRHGPGADDAPARHQPDAQQRCGLAGRHGHMEGHAAETFRPPSQRLHGAGRRRRAGGHRRQVDHPARRRHGLDRQAALQRATLGLRLRQRRHQPGDQRGHQPRRGQGGDAGRQAGRQGHRAGRIRRHAGQGAEARRQRQGRAGRTIGLAQHPVHRPQHGDGQAAGPLQPQPFQVGRGDDHRRAGGQRSQFRGADQEGGHAAFSG
ncbi:hypothetical protein SAMN02745775_105312 [Falsiroseomonas stagni DSM 19981]|uniref:Uncharacterized protein n=1 Tax=Falsiroseomonas stagni DSM 19981 TaxID=1123062 RepID=A0A1I4BIH4_9PROT|nr:hypothetical protein SAMN02745775_105312 [Falsiroseomonas stagni DSM 19981]